MTRQKQKVHSKTNAYMHDWPTWGNSWYEEITWYEGSHSDQMTGQKPKEEE